MRPMQTSIQRGKEMILTDEEIGDVYEENISWSDHGTKGLNDSEDVDGFARDIEQAVIKKLKQKATDEHCVQAWKDWHGPLDDDVIPVNFSFEKGWKWCFKNIFGEG